MPKKKRKTKKRRLPKLNYHTPISKIRPVTQRRVPDVLVHAREYPILGCWKYADLEEVGIGTVVVARQQSKNRVFFASCLVDIWCLGVKDAYTKVDVSLKTFHRMLPKLCSGDDEPCSVEYAHELIYGAIEYAGRYGFKPHPDFTRLKADCVLDPPEMHPRSGEITFGKDGQPLFVAGPYDDKLRCNQILNTLNRTAGEGNFHFLMSSPEF